MTVNASAARQASVESNLPRWLAAIPGWELVVYGSFGLIAVAARFSDLGFRALHHDESLHAVYSWYLYVGRGYRHDPLMHGPFQFHATALSYFLFGDSDATARFPAAIFGVAIVLLPILLRPIIGGWAALSISGLLLISPVFLYFSRFAREDIYVATFTLALAIFIWRYLASHDKRWLFAIAAALALAFSAKETTYITVALFGSFFTIRWLSEVLRNLREGVAVKKAVRGKNLDILIILGSFTLPLLAAFSGLGFPIVGIGTETVATIGGIGEVSAENVAAAIVVTAALAVSAIVGTLWNRRIWWPAAAIFFLIFALLHTAFLSNPAGIGSGLWGSLDYWLAQQGVARGNQPGYYYVLLLPIYEFLPLGIVVVGGLIAAIRKSFLWLPIGLAALPIWFIINSLGDTAGKVAAIGLFAVVMAAIVGAGRVQGWRMFLLYWTVGALVAYSIAGEKMPWLSLHMALPMILLAGALLGDLLASVDWRKWVRGPAPYVAAGIPVGLLLIVVLARGELAGGLSLTSLLMAGGTVLVLVWAIAWFAETVGRRTAAASIGVALLSVALALTIRTGVVAAFENGDVPVEMLVYTQTSPDIPRIARDLGVWTSSRVYADPVDIVVDSEGGYTWPWAWYLRDTERVSYPNLSSVDEAQVKGVVIVHNQNNGNLQPYLERFETPERLRHRWWFPEDYKGLTTETLVANLLNPDSYGIWWNYFLYRKTVKPLGTTDAFIYLPKVSVAENP